MTDLVILADGGGGIGLGHIMRCLAIKHAWNNGTAKLLVQMEGNNSIPDGGEALNWLAEIECLNEHVSSNTLLLVDSYRPDINYFWQLKKLFPFVVVFDDYNRIPYPVDLLICPGVYGNEVDYSNQSAITVGGAEYVILRPEILAIEQSEIRAEVETVLLTLGGSQQDESLFQRINDILEGAGYQVVIVTGNEHLVEYISSKKSQVFGKLSPLKMAEIMASSDIAVSAAGQTLNEFAWLGVPTFSVKTGEDQHGNWYYYKHHKLSLGAELSSSQSLESALIEAIENESVDSRLARSSRLRSLLTATGAEAICSLIEKRGNIVDE